MKEPTLLCWSLILLHPPPPQKKNDSTFLASLLVSIFSTRYSLIASYASIREKGGGGRHPYRTRRLQKELASSRISHSKANGMCNFMSAAVFRIRHILVRIRIRGSVPLTNWSGSRSGSCSCRLWPSGLQQKIYIFFFAYYCTLWRYIYIVLQKIKSHKSYYFCVMMEGYGYVPLTNGSGSGRPKNVQIRNTGQ